MVMKQVMKRMLQLRVGYGCPSLKKQLLMFKETTIKRNHKHTHNETHTHTHKKEGKIILNVKVILFWPRLFN